MDQDKITKIASIVIGVVLAAVLVVVGFRLVSGKFGRATGPTPVNIAATNLTQNSATITFTTDEPALCTVTYGPTGSTPSFFAADSQETTSHAIPLTLLTVDTTYNCSISCGGGGDDSLAGQTCQFTTAGAVAAQPTVAIPTATPEPLEATATPVSEGPASYCDSVTTIQGHIDEDSTFGTVDCLQECGNAQICAAAFASGQD